MSAFPGARVGAITIANLWPFSRSNCVMRALIATANTTRDWRNCLIWTTATQPQQPQPQPGDDLEKDRPEAETARKVGPEVSLIDMRKICGVLVCHVNQSNWLAWKQVFNPSGGDQVRPRPGSKPRNIEQIRVTTSGSSFRWQSRTLRRQFG